MPPTFPPRSNTIARISIPLVLILLIVLVGGGYLFAHSKFVTGVGVEVPQPVPFPHNFHVSGLGLDCRYCHMGVDQTSFADLPPTETCMSCHSQVALNSAKLQPVRDSWANGTAIQWNRVNNVPDFVYFDHQIHVSKGVACETCHGRVDKMTTDVKTQAFYMSFCTNCHQNPAKYLRPVDQVYAMGYKPAGDQATIGAQLVQQYHILSSNQLTNCSICHR